MPTHTARATRIARATLAFALATAALTSGGCASVAETRRFQPGLTKASVVTTPAVPEPSGSAAEGAETSTSPRAVPRSLRRLSPRRGAYDPDERFDAARAMEDARNLAAFGSRPGGSEQERFAAEYVERRLRSMGYEPVVRTFELPNGRTSRNVIASVDGYASSRALIVGAHIDTKPPSPGANDNASGAGVLLELARLLRESPAAGRVVFVFFGAEEFLTDAPGDAHHLGSRNHAASLSAEERASTAGMISVDMVGYGSRFHVRDMRRGPRSLTELLLADARRQQVALSFEKDLGSTGWSDQEPYELAGIPASWLQWQSDPTYHTERDSGEHLQRRPFETTGGFLLRFLRRLQESDLERLCDR